MSNRVPPWGSRDSRIALIGEAPGEWEDRQRRPFVGPSGYKLQDWWREVGLKRDDFYIDNVFPVRPPNNDLSKVDRLEVQEAAQACVARLRDLPNLKLIVPTGNYALRAVLGDPLWGMESAKIGNLRGSIIPHEIGGRKVKVIPTIHPAMCFRQPRIEKLCVADWKRIAGYLANPKAFKRKKRELNWNPTLRDIKAFEKEVAAAAESGILSIDIETNPPERQLLCVGFALTPYFGISLEWGTWQQAIGRLCRSPIAKVGQNFLYDAYWLSFHGITVKNWRYDTLALNHCRDSNLPHDLATQASLYTTQQFWKRDAKDEAVQRKLDISKFDALKRYNCIDACVTREILDVHLAALAEGDHP